MNKQDYKAKKSFKLDLWLTAEKFWTPFKLQPFLNGNICPCSICSAQVPLKSHQLLLFLFHLPLKLLPLLEPVSKSTFANHPQFVETHIEVKILFSIGSNKSLILGREAGSLSVCCTLLACFLTRWGKRSIRYSMFSWWTSELSFLWQNLLLCIGPAHCDNRTCFPLTSQNSFLITKEAFYTYFWVNFALNKCQHSTAFQFHFIE